MDRLAAGSHEVQPAPTSFTSRRGPFGTASLSLSCGPAEASHSQGPHGVFLDRSARHPAPAADELVMVKTGSTRISMPITKSTRSKPSASLHARADSRRGRAVDADVPWSISPSSILINSLHLHGMFLDVFRTGTSMTSSETTDTIMLCQGERAIMRTRFRYPGQFIHAHQSEFAELGWMGLFEAVEVRRDT